MKKLHANQWPFVLPGRQSFLYLAIIILVSIPVIVPFLHHGYFPTHDGEWAVVRLAEMFRELRDHQFPPRYSGYLNNGYGYALFNFDYPGPYLTGIPFVLAKLGFVNTIKVLFGASVLIGAIGMYLASGKFWNNRTAGLVSAVFYLYLPYHFVDLFVRGSLGETMSFAILPFVIYCIVKIREKENSLYWIGVASLLIGVSVLLHNIMALVCVPILLGCMLSQIISFKRSLMIPYISALIAGWGLSAFFWIPALVEKHYVLLSTIPIADRSLYFVQVAQFIFPSWGYGVPTDPNDPFTYQLGWPLLLGVLISASLLFYKNVPAKKNLSILVGLWVCYCMLLFSWTERIWGGVPLLREINYPWTLLGPIGFVSALLVGILTKFSRLRIVALVLMTVFILVTIQYAHPKTYIDRGDTFYITNAATTTSSQELMPLWVKEFPTRMPDKKIEVLRGIATSEQPVFNSRSILTTVIAQTPATIRLNTIYYPGWKITVNGKTVPISYANTKGVMDIQLHQGTNTVHAVFSETVDRLVSNGISVISLMCILILLFFHQVKKIWHYKKK